jgi:4-amino-4-deoxy-L-arabinose transferase-like glycosyltransferase
MTKFDKAWYASLIFFGGLCIGRYSINNDIDSLIIGTLVAIAATIFLVIRKEHG